MVVWGGGREQAGEMTNIKFEVDFVKSVACEPKKKNKNISSDNTIRKNNLVFKTLTLKRIKYCFSFCLLVFLV